ncbi:MAG: SpoIIE family protein phosphatase [Planctomycetia bacterium]|nr:SpoIIE family protein phosphatase [Planctomycetia bacterium]
MRKIFHKWLFVFVAIAFTFTFCISYYLQTQQAELAAEKMINRKIAEVVAQLAKNNDYRQTVLAHLEAEAVDKVSALAGTLRSNKELLNDSDLMRQILVAAQIEHAILFDGDGAIEAEVDSSTGQTTIDKNFIETIQKEFKDPEFRLVDVFPGQGILAATTRLDTAGALLICYNPDRLNEVALPTETANRTIAAGIGATGEIVLARKDRIVSIADAQMTGQNILSLGIPFRRLREGQGTFWVYSRGVKTLCCYERIGDYNVIGLLPSTEIFESRDQNAFTLILLNFLLFGAVFLLVNEMIKRVVIVGIESVNSSLKRITEGNLEEKVQVFTNEEFVSLSAGINATVQALRQAIHDAAARIDNELEFARAIQLSAMPNVFPPYPTRNEFDIYASMYTARNVGGDFYDFFLIDNDHLAIVIADVSGKGIPAALFMMTSKTAIKNYAESGLTPSQIFTRSNTYLCENNEACMFVTAFLGILEISTGKLTTVSAGHNPPVLIRADGSVEYMESSGGFVLAGMPLSEYSESVFQLQEGDKIFMYTDGVTEAFDRNGQMFGENRLKETLGSPYASRANLLELISFIKSEIDTFADDHEQSDDITMLVLEYKRCSAAGN